MLRLLEDHLEIVGLQLSRDKAEYIGSDADINIEVRDGPLNKARDNCMRVLGAMWI